MQHVLMGGLSGKWRVVDNKMQPVWTEDDRLATLRSYRVLDTPSEPTFDDLVQLAARLPL